MYAWSLQSLDLMLSGLFSTPPSFGSFVSMMDQSDEGRNLLRALKESTLDIVNIISIDVNRGRDFHTYGRYIPNLTRQDGSAFERQYSQSLKRKGQTE